MLYYVMLRYAMLCCILFDYAMLSMLCYARLCYVVQYAMLCRIMLGLCLLPVSDL